MEKLTAPQIIEKLNSLEEIYNEEEDTGYENFKDAFGYNDMASDDQGDLKELGEIEYLIDSERALEGDSECMTTVVLFKDHGVYIRLDGYYASYGGSDWDGDYFEVKPVEKTVTFYEAIK